MREVDSFSECFPSSLGVHYDLSTLSLAGAFPAVFTASLQGLPKLAWKMSVEPAGLWAGFLSLIQSEPLSVCFPRDPKSLFYPKSNLACLSWSLVGLASGLLHLMDFDHLGGCGAEERY